MKVKGFVLGTLMVISIIAGCPDCGKSYQDGDRAFIEFEVSRMSSRTIGSDEYWDVTMRSWRVTPDDHTLHWLAIWMDISIKTGPNSYKQVVYFEDMTPDDPSSYDVTEPISIEGWYIDKNGDDMVGVGDELKITGLNRSFEEGSVYLEYGDPSDWFSMIWVGSFDLPETFQAMESDPEGPSEDGSNVGLIILFLSIVMIIVVALGLVAVYVKRKKSAPPPQPPGYPPPPQGPY